MAVTLFYDNGSAVKLLLWYPLLLSDTVLQIASQFTRAMSLRQPALQTDHPMTLSSTELVLCVVGPWASREEEGKKHEEGRQELKYLRQGRYCTLVLSLLHVEGTLLSIRSRASNIYRLDCLACVKADDAAEITCPRVLEA